MNVVSFSEFAVNVLQRGDVSREKALKESATKKKRLSRMIASVYLVLRSISFQSCKANVTLFTFFVN